MTLEVLVGDSVALKRLGACLKQGNLARNGKKTIFEDVFFGFHLSRSFSRYRDRDGQIPDIAVPRRPRIIRVPALTPL